MTTAHASKRSACLAGAFAVAFGLCNAVAAQPLVTNLYSVDTNDFPNPERGFYIQADTYASAPSPVPSNLASFRINGRNSPGNTYNARISLLLRLFYLDSFVSSPISSNFLASMQNDFDAVRAQGDKVIIRFAYTQKTTRPFGEPSKAQILAHIAQVKPLLQKNCDVIAAVQLGFIGAWGEGYYSDVFYTNGSATRRNWQDRTDLLSALLDALPATRMVQVRIPQQKQKFVYGPSAPTSAAPLPLAQAFSGLPAARIGFHDDCYLADATDEGTFANYDLGGPFSSQDAANLRNYQAQETRFAPIGGETCAVNPPTDDCTSVGGNADADMALEHYSFLNEGYNASVNNKWAQHGCIEDIKRRLGYRLLLTSGIFPVAAQPGQSFPITLNFQNLGYASPYNPRGLELVLRDVVSGRKFFAALSPETDPRLWFPGSNSVVNARIALPTNMPFGNYDLLLNLPDPAPSLYGTNAYSIHLANSNALSASGAVLTNVWEPATAFHRLGVTLAVNATAANPPAAPSDVPALPFSAIAETYDTWRTRNFPGHPTTGATNADPDGDGRLNLMEYAVGSDPNAPDHGSSLEVSFVNNSFFLTAHKGPGVKDVDFELASSPVLDSATWSTSSITILANDASVFQARYDGGGEMGFLRLKVSLR